MRRGRAGTSSRRRLRRSCSQPRVTVTADGAEHVQREVTVMATCSQDSGFAAVTLVMGLQLSQRCVGGVHVEFVQRALAASWRRYVKRTPNPNCCCDVGCM